MTTTDTPSQGIGLPEAATQFEALLSGETGKQTPEQDAAEETPADEAEGLEASDAVDETPADEADATDEDAAANDEEADEPSDPMDQLYTVKIDGKDEQVSLKEALAGYQRQADYSQKTMALAREEKALRHEHQLAQQQVQSERAQYAQLLGALQQQLEATVPQEPDWDRLYAEDPLEYVRQKDLHRDHRDRLQAAQAEQQRVATLMQHQHAQQLQAIVQQGREKIAEAVPAWKDKAKWESDRVKLRDYAQSLGYTPEEVGQVYDPRAVVALNKARLYDELMAKKPQPQQQTGPKPLRAGTPQAAPQRRASEVTRQKQRLAQTGHVKDAAKLFESLI